MQIEFTQETTHLVATLQGPRLDALGALDFKEEFRDTASSTEQDIVMDMQKIDFMDSSGLGALVAIAKLVPDPHALKFQNLQPLVARVFHLTHMDRVFTILPNAAGPLNVASA